MPMMAAINIHYDIADRTRAIAAGGIGAIHLMAQKIGLVEDINHNHHLLKRHLPYHESDHVLAIASNILARSSRLVHLDIRRQDQTFLDALGAQRLPNPTTAGGFCRRFTAADRLLALHDLGTHAICSREIKPLRHGEPSMVGPLGDELGPGILLTWDRSVACPMAPCWRRLIPAWPIAGVTPPAWWSGSSSTPTTTPPAPGRANTTG